MSDVIYGKNSVIEFLRTKPEQVEKVYIYNNIENNKSTQEVFELIKENKIVFIKVDRSKLNLMSEGGNHQGVVLTVSGQAYSEIEDILKNAKNSGKPPFILILDSINDPHNFGSIIRTAECAGVHGIIIPKRNAVGLTPLVNKISCGAAAHVPIAKVSNLNYAIEKLKKENIWIAGAEADAEKLYTEVDYNMPVALVLGGEDAGISQLTKKLCDFLVKIPGLGKVSSLNVGVSAGILIYEVVRQREK